MSSNKQRLQEELFYTPIIGLAIIFLAKLFKFSYVLLFYFKFMLDFLVHLPRLVFFAKYGFHQLVPNWFNGFDYILFKFYPPGWYFFTLPIYYITKDPRLAALISVLLLYILGFIFIHFLGKVSRFSLTKKTAFFLFFFASPLMINVVFDIGRVVDLFSMVMFIPFFALIIYCKNHETSKNIILLAPLFGILILSHIYIAIPAAFLIMSLFLIKGNKERFFIIALFLIALLLTIFWWLPFTAILGIRDNLVENTAFSRELLFKNSIFSLNSVIIPAFFLLFFLYWMNKHKSKKEFLFFLPLLLLAFLIISRLIVFIPILNIIPVNIYNEFFLFLSLFLFFSIRYYPKTVRNLAIIGIILLPILFLATTIHFDNLTRVLEREPTGQEATALQLVQGAEGNYLILSETGNFDRYYLNAHIAMDYDKTTPDGNDAQYATKDNYLVIDEINRDLRNHNCSLTEKLDDLDVELVLTYGDNCMVLDSCGMEREAEENDVCLFSRK